MKDLRSPLARARGLGVSADATNDFWLQRLTALALVPLVIWFTFNIALLPEVSYHVLINWFQSPFNSVMMILIVAISFIHAHLGVQVIIEDYIHTYNLRIALILIVKFTSYFLMVLAVYLILKLSLGAH
jgi:succinate dehydrogenase / fumarate reductase membrane anchor subunit